jgi:hypothetical protein
LRIRIQKITREEWQDIVNLTGMPTVPTIKYKGEFLVAGRDFGNPTNLIDIISNGFKSREFFSRLRMDYSGKDKNNELSHVSSFRKVGSIVKTNRN